ncbi:hypothetical protein ACK6SG_01850 [Enterobacter hormaechei]|uniref:hypothetical protein n=1 Tax=Enterobacter hormaechei TaxID=158836 RepID=UPI003C2FAD14
MMNKKLKICLAVVVAVGVAVYAYRTGRIDGNDARDEYHLKNDLSGSMSLACTSNIADNQLNRNLFINFDNQLVMYSPELHIEYNRQSVFVGRGTVFTLMNEHYFTEITQIGDYARVNIQKNGHFVDSLECQVQQIK